MANANTTIQVSTIRHTAIAAGLVEIFTSTRETKDKKIAPENRTRAILIPELSTPELPEKFAAFVLDQLYSIAKDQLADMWKEAKDGLKEVPADVWTVDSLLAFAARKSESQKLSAELVKTASQEFLDSEVPKDKHDAVRDALINYAAPTPNVPLKRSIMLRDWLASYKKENELHWVLVSLERRILKRISELESLVDSF